MTTIEAVKLIAEYDGWVAKDSYGDWFKKSGTVALLIFMPYLTDLNELHRVALGVMDELDDMFLDTEKYYANQPLFVDGVVNQESLKAKRISKIDRLSYGILFCLRLKPKNSQYPDLLLAVARGVEFINEHKTA